MKGKNSPSKNFPLTFRLKDLDRVQPYLDRLGIKPHTVDLFDLAYYSGPGTLGGRVIVPIHDVGGALIAYAGCAAEPGANPEQLFIPPQFDASLELYNLRRAIAAQTEVVVVVEDFFDCMKITQSGFPGVTALMGNRMSDAQEIALVEKFSRVLLLLDGDDAGWRATQDCIRRLSTQVFVRAAVLPSNTKPMNLSEDEICAIIRS